MGWQIYGDKLKNHISTDEITSQILVKFLFLNSFQGEHPKYSLLEYEANQT